MKNQKGFSLIELLVVVIIIAIIAAIAIPSLLASRRAANQSATVANLRTVVSADATHASLAQGNYAATLAALNTANYLDASWAAATVTKNGYTYAYTPASATNPNTGYCVTATATESAGDNSYSTSHQGAIYFLAGTTAPTCVATTGVISTGAVISQ
ncbi:MAG: prepilin-type N-terminal cleavage/methylation domain-containing protein [Pyrinomonadaceae bacterium]